MMMVIIILVEGWEGVRRDITIDFVWGNNYLPRMIIYHNILIQGYYVYISILQKLIVFVSYLDVF